MGSPEAYVERYLVHRAEQAGIMVRKLEFPGSSGAPDRILMHNGLCVFVECKRTRKGRLSALQHVTIARIRAQGLPCVVADSREDADRIVAWMQAHRAPAPEKAPAGQTREEAPSGAPEGAS